MTWAAVGPRRVPAAAGALAGRAARRVGLQAVLPDRRAAGRNRPADHQAEAETRRGASRNRRPAGYQVADRRAADQAADRKPLAADRSLRAAEGQAGDRRHQAADRVADRNRRADRRATTQDYQVAD